MRQHVRTRGIAEHARSPRPTLTCACGCRLPARKATDMSAAETRDAGAGTAASAFARSAGGTAAAIRAVAERVAEAGQSSPRQARDPGNLPMIRSWIEAIGDANPGHAD